MGGASVASSPSTLSKGLLRGRPARDDCDDDYDKDASMISLRDVDMDLKQLQRQVSNLRTQILHCLVIYVQTCNGFEHDSNIQNSPSCRGQNSSEGLAVYCRRLR